MAYAVGLRLLGGHLADAEDALQETWLRAVRGLAGFRRLHAFARGSSEYAIRVALEAGAPRSPKASRFSETESMVVWRPDCASTSNGSSIRLPHGYRHVLLLHDIEGHTHEEIARLLDIEAGTSKSQLSRARSFLRRWLSRPAEELRHG